MKNHQNDLLRDLVILLKRHGAQDWVRLADLIEDQEGRAAIVRFLRGVANSRTFREKQRMQPQRSPSKAKVPASQDANRDRLELQLSRASTDRLREIAQKTGIHSSSKDSRQRLIKRLSNLVSRKRLKKEEKSLPGKPQERDDYVQWADIILGRHSPKSRG